MGHLVASGSLLIALPVAVAAGAVTFVSPCCLPLVPGYLSYVTGMSGADAVTADRDGAVRQGRTVAGTALFVLGFSALFTSYGAAFSAGRGAFLAFAYALGIGIPFLLIAAAFQRGMTTAGFARRHGRLVTRVGGALLVVLGVAQVTGAWTAVLDWLRVHWVGGYQLPF